MKKIFSLMSALVVALAINATDYYISGIGGWAEPGTKAELKLVGEGDVLTCNFDRIDAGSEFKVFANTGWSGPEYGAAAKGDAVTPNGAAYTMVSPAENLKIALAEKHYLTGAVVSVNTTTWEVTVTGTDVDGSAEADTYQIVGVGGDWDAGKAAQFEEVEGVLTVTIPALSGTFKIIQNRKWDNQWATNWETKGKLGENEPYVLGAKGANGEPANLTLAKPFGTYKDAKLTLEINEGVYTLTMVEGTYEFTQADWYFPGSKLGWNCNDQTKFEPVAGEENTYEIAMAEFGNDFKVVYGNWMVEFGSPKGGDTIRWVVNEPMELATPCENVYAVDKDQILEDVIARIEVDYETAEVVLTLEVEETAFEQIATEKGAVKVIENGKVIVIKNGVRYSVKGAKL